MVQHRFTTDRLQVTHWRTAISTAQGRAHLAAALTGLLTPEVLRHLPPTFQIAGAQDAVARWIAARDAESDVLTITHRKSGALLGLMILAPDPETVHPPLLHLGYLLGEPAWGKGYATELIRGFAAAQSGHAPLTLQGGVATDNPASARVLEKAGFTLRADLSDGETQIYEHALP